MTGAFNRFFDKWPMATILRVLAILLFLLDVGLNVFAMIANHTISGTAYAFGVIIAMLVKNMYQPVVLLGLAEVIGNKKTLS
jgi:hypothetical protein